MKPGPEHITLLTEPMFAPFLHDYLLEQNADLTVRTASSISGLESAIEQAGIDTRLISFLTNVIVPGPTLAALNIEPYNIHPGPPEVPGVNPEVFAICDGANSFGVTAHVILQRIDSGPIVYCERFSMPDRPKRRALADMTFPYALKAFQYVADHCALSTDPLPRVDVDWTGPLRTRKAFDELCLDADRLMRACGEGARSA
ncbi:MAG: hypothetical protein AAGD13_22270 [Pseudomonadota bacterium]